MHRFWMPFLSQVTVYKQEIKIQALRSQPHTITHWPHPLMGHYQTPEERALPLCGGFTTPVLEHTVPVLILSYEFLCLAIFLLHQCSVRSKSLFHLWVFCLWHFQQLLKIYLPFNRSLNAHQQSVTYHSAINGYQNKTQSSFNMAECYRVVTGFTPWGNKGVAWRKR